MKVQKFPFKYGVLIYLLLIAVALISVASIITNVYDAVTIYGENTARFVLSVAVAVVSAALCALSVSVMAGGKYVVKDGFLYCRFGFIFTKTDIKTIVQVTEFTALKKLVIYFDSGKYSVAVIDEKYYGAFFAALKEYNRNLTFTVQGKED